METLRKLHSGKVRDVYDAGGGRLLMVASDRLSAFDVVLAETVPDKGRVLTAMSAFWFEALSDVAPSHLLSTDPSQFPPGSPADSAGRGMLVAAAEMLPIECIVRGYLSGSAWSEYCRSGTVHGVAMREGARESEKLPEPVFTASTKAVEGHDENITFDRAVSLVGRETAERAAEIALAAYCRAAELAETRGLVLADTKFELGFVDGRLSLCDEVLTPDSSRWWEADAWAPGSTPPSYDKQPVRDWLAGTGWDRTPPAPPLPGSVVEATRRRYVEVYERVSGRRLGDWPGGSVRMAGSVS